MCLRFEVVAPYIDLFTDQERQYCKTAKTQRSRRSRRLSLNVKRRPLRSSRLGGSFFRFDASVARRQRWDIKIWGILFPCWLHLIEIEQFFHSAIAPFRLGTELLILGESLEPSLREKVEWKLRWLMAITAAEFFKHFKKLNAYLSSNPDASDELRERTRELASAFRSCYTADAFRQAVAKNEEVESELEDRTTSALMAYTQDRATRSS